MDLNLVRIILVCFWALSAIQILTHTLVFCLGYDMSWGKLGNAYGGMFLWGYLLGKLDMHLKEQ